MTDKTKGQPGFSVHRLPSSYPLTTQQQMMKDAAQACGIRKGMSRSELLEAMSNCVPQYFEKLNVERKLQKGEAMPNEGKKAIKVYHSPHCESCHQIADLLTKGKFESNIKGDVPVDLIDVTSEEGFKEIGKEGVDSVPTARYDGKVCKLGVDEKLGVVVIECDVPLEDQAEAPAPNPEV